ncbi:MAG: 2-oxoacid:acceptor oxidoreductase family protein [Spirochaetes bacterium]|nr:2-oxoacid:acceptor oxidoreductase family protein [Spirochaetota bacterium]MBU1080518.1 2-oxoacid:acceptor oxidoreductase family protein [Spirochaetota bacterium]
MRTEFRLSGSGGQGLLLAGIVLAEAAILEDKFAVQTQSYGPEARGGSSKAEVVVSEEDIDYPKATDPDYLLALTADSYRTYGKLQGKGLIIVDSSVQLDPEIKARTTAVPILETASVGLGRKVVANIVALGVLGGISGVVKAETLEAAVLNRVPKGTEELNIKALRAGLELAAKAKKA